MLVPNSARTIVLPAACHRPTDLARVPQGIASQSHSPNTAAATAPIVQQHLQQAQVLNVDATGQGQGMMNQGSMGGQQGSQGGGASRAGERG